MKQSEVRLGTMYSCLESDVKITRGSFAPSICLQMLITETCHQGLFHQGELNLQLDFQVGSSALTFLLCVNLSNPSMSLVKKKKVSIW